jgi:hypothetical protein
MNHAEIIENDKGDIKLVRLIYIDHKSEAFIEFNSIKHPNYPDQHLSWDNDNFIFGKFYKFLKRWKNGKLKKKDEEKFKDVWPILININVVDELIEMIEFALEKEWYEFKE